MTLYEKLAEHFIIDIQAGRLMAGARLPALRRVASLHNVSLTTAVKAYEYLERGGWIIAQAQSGFFVSALFEYSDVPLSPVFKSQSRDPNQRMPVGGYIPNNYFFCPLGTSMLSPDLLPSTELRRSIQRAARVSGHSLHSYPEIQGRANLRAALSSHFQKYSFSFSADELVITHGCLHAVRLAVDCVSKEGDTLAVSSPCFNGLLELLANMSRKILEIPCTDNGIDLDQLETHMKTHDICAGLFSTSHMNPSGANLSIEQKKRLALLAENYKIPIIEDDVYMELAHTKKPPLPAKHWDKAGEILWCGSVSKTLAAGMRLGWCLPGRYTNEYVKRHQITSYGVNTIMQSSLCDFINSGDYLSHINKIRVRLVQQLKQYQQFLRAHLGSNARISAPRGGMVLWVQIAGLDTFELVARANAEEIDIRGGYSFSAEPYYNDCFRVNTGWPLMSPDHSDDTDNLALRHLARVCELVVEITSKSQGNRH